MPKTYAQLKMNADAIIARIQALPDGQEGREWALELGTPEGKHVRYSAEVSPLWTILEGISTLHQGGEMPFRYARILRLADGSGYSRTFNEQQLLHFGDLARIREALEVEKQIQQAKGGLGGQDEQAKLEIF